MLKKIFTLIILSSLSFNAYAGDFEIPHRLNSGSILSADILNEMFDKVHDSQRAVTENDLIGEWSCEAFLDGSVYVEDESLFLENWELLSDATFVRLEGVTLIFSQNSEGYNLASNEPNPVNVGISSSINSVYSIKGDKISFYYTSGGAVIYDIKKISPTRIGLTPFKINPYISHLICDLQNLPPENPKQLSATLSGSTVSLTWSDESEDETGFKILRRDSLTGEFAEIGTASANATSYTDTLSADGKYWYRVVAVNENGDSLGSNVVKVTLGDEDDTQSLKNELRMMRERMQLIEDELGESGGRP